MQTHAQAHTILHNNCRNMTNNKLKHMHAAQMKPKRKLKGTAHAHRNACANGNTHELRSSNSTKCLSQMFIIVMLASKIGTLYTPNTYKQTNKQTNKRACAKCTMHKLYMKHKQIKRGNKFGHATPDTSHEPLLQSQRNECFTCNATITAHFRQNSNKPK